MKVVHVYDGDTFFVDLSAMPTLFGKRIGVRVWGIDTPEMRGGNPYEKAMALKAKIFTRDLIAKTKRVDLKYCTRGKYFRIVCKVYLDSVSLSTSLIKNGLAIPYMEK